MGNKPSEPIPAPKHVKKYPIQPLSKPAPEKYTSVWREYHELTVVIRNHLMFQSYTDGMDASTLLGLIHQIIDELLLDGTSREEVRRILRKNRMDSTIPYELIKQHDNFIVGMLKTSNEYTRDLSEVSVRVAKLKEMLTIEMREIAPVGSVDPLLQLLNTIRNAVKVQIEE